MRTYFLNFIVGDDFFAKGDHQNYLKSILGGARLRSWTVVIPGSFHAFWGWCSIVSLEGRILNFPTLSIGPDQYSYTNSRQFVQIQWIVDDPVRY